MNNEQIISAIKSLLDSNSNNITVAIDGPSASGKTHLTAILKEVFDCNVFHMDDFFLPFERKTPERLAQAGGNVDYERMEVEILSKLSSKKPFVYDIYSCQTQTKTPSESTTSKRLNIVEGVYSMHPELINYYNFTIFLDVERNMQLDRILKRSNEFMLGKFKNEWIPMEDYYFNQLDLRKKADILMDTTSLF